MRKKSNAKTNIALEIKPKSPWTLTSVSPLPDYCLKVTFLDGTQGMVDMSQRVKSKKAGVFEHLRDIKIFNQVFLCYGAVTWPGNIDLAPDAMHDAIKRSGKWVLN